MEMEIIIEVWIYTLFIWNTTCQIITIIIPRHVLCIENIPVHNLQRVGTTLFRSKNIKYISPKNMQTNIKIIKRFMSFIFLISDGMWRLEIV